MGLKLQKTSISCPITIGQPPRQPLGPPSNIKTHGAAPGNHTKSLSWPKQSFSYSMKKTIFEFPRPFLRHTLTDQADSGDKRQGGGAPPTLKVSGQSVHRARTSSHRNRRTDRQTDIQTAVGTPSHGFPLRKQ